MRTLVVAIIIIFSINLAAQDAYPKLMHYIDGKYVNMKYHEGKTSFYNWKDDEVIGIKLPADPYLKKYCFVDDKGVQINADIYDYAEPFIDGLATVALFTEQSKNAVINAKGEYVFPFSDCVYENLTKGFIQEVKKNKQAIYDSSQKLVSECVSCTFTPNFSLHRIIRMPKFPCHTDSQFVYLLDFNGNVLLKKFGQHAAPFSNQIVVNNRSVYENLSAFRLTINSQTDLHAAFDKNGKLIMDSLIIADFYYGKAYVTKNKIAAVIDTNFKEIMPFSYGNEFYRQLQGYPEEWYCARKNGRYRIVDKQNNQMFPFTSSQEIWYNKKEPYFTFIEADKGTWLISFTGDTIVSGEKYEYVRGDNPNLKGFLVKCKGKSNFFGFVSSETKQLTIPCEYKQLDYAGKDLLLYFKDFEAGYLDQKGNVTIRIQNCLKLSKLNSGYAICGFKSNHNSPSAQSVITDEGNYQVQYKMLDSTGNLVSEKSFDWIYAMKRGTAMVISKNESYLVDTKMNRILVNNKYSVISYFQNGYALLADLKKGKLGLVNEKLQVVIPPIYDRIDTVLDETVFYGFELMSNHGYESQGLFKNSFAKINDGKLRATLNGKDQFISIAN